MSALLARIRRLCLAHVAGLFLLGPIALALPAVRADELSPYRSTEFPMRAAPQAQSYPKVAGKWVVWQEGAPNAGSLIAGRNLDTGLDFTINPAAALASQLALGGDVVVDVEMGFDQTTRTPTYGVFGYSLPGGRRSTIADFEGGTVNGSPVYRSGVQTDGRTVVWLESSAAGAPRYIYGFDLTAQRMLTISTGLAETDWPAVAGNLVVWRDKRDSATPDQTADHLRLRSGRRPGVSRYRAPRARFGSGCVRRPRRVVHDA